MTRRKALLKPLSSGTPEFWALSCRSSTKATAWEGQKTKTMLVKWKLSYKLSQKVTVFLQGSKRDILITLQQEAGPATNLPADQVTASLSPQQKREFISYGFLLQYYQRRTL
jgi:hypothetical protein